MKGKGDGLKKTVRGAPGRESSFGGADERRGSYTETSSTINELRNDVTGTEGGL